MAARACDLPLMKLLLDLGADPRIPNADNASPLLAAAGVGALQLPTGRCPAAAGG